MNNNKIYPTLGQLKTGSLLIKNIFPNGPAVRTTYPDKQFSFNEISSNIRTTLNEISKSLNN
jgi:hypothetical protein